MRCLDLYLELLAGQGRKLDQQFLGHSFLAPRLLVFRLVEIVFEADQLLSHLVLISVRIVS